MAEVLLITLENTDFDDEKRRTRLKRFGIEFRQSPRSFGPIPSSYRRELAWIDTQEEVRQWFSNPERNKLWLVGDGNQVFSILIHGHLATDKGTVGYCSLHDMAGGTETASAVLVCVLHDILLARDDLMRYWQILIDKERLGPTPIVNDDGPENGNWYHDFDQWEDIWFSMLKDATKGDRPITFIINDFGWFQGGEREQSKLLCWISGIRDNHAIIDQNLIRTLVTDRNPRGLSRRKPGAGFVVVNVLDLENAVGN